MLAKHTLVLMFERKGMKLRTWAFSMGLRNSDIPLLYELSSGKTQGKYGRAKELKELLIKEGFGKHFKRVEKSRTDGADELKKGA
jgi:hypothetical protein